MRSSRNLMIVAAAVLAGTVGGLAIALVRRGGADDGPIEAPQPAARAALLLAAHTGNPGFATADGDVVDVYDPNCTSAQLKALIVSYRRDLLSGGARQLRCAGRPTAENIVEEPLPRTREIADSATPAPDAQVMTAAQQAQHDRDLAAEQARHAAEWAAEDERRERGGAPAADPAQRRADVLASLRIMMRSFDVDGSVAANGETLVFSGPDEGCDLKTLEQLRDSLVQFDLDPKVGFSSMRCSNGIELQLR